MYTFGLLFKTTTWKLQRNQRLFSYY